MINMKDNIHTISMDQEYKTRDGRKVRVLCLDRLTTSEYVVYAAVTFNNNILGEEWESMYVYTIEGRLNAWKETHLDLVPVPKEYWINVYVCGNSALHKTKEEADRCGDSDRIACIKFKKGEGL